MEGYNGQAAGRNLQIQMSWDGGAYFTTVTAARTTTLPITDGTVILGSSVDTWGRAWSNTEFTNTNFTVKATFTGGPTPPVYLDQLQVRVYYTAGNTPTATATFKPLAYVPAGIFAVSFKMHALSQFKSDAPLFSIFANATFTYNGDGNRVKSVMQTDPSTGSGQVGQLQPTSWAITTS